MDKTLCPFRSTLTKITFWTACFVKAGKQVMCVIKVWFCDNIKLETIMKVVAEVTLGTVVKIWVCPLWGMKV